jgi:hypothetical protein
VHVGPATGGEFNTLRIPRAPVGCWRLEDMRFEFDSSFIGPPAAEEFRNFAALMQSRPKAVVSVFGHADPTGDDDYNKKLSGRRATAVFAVLTRRADLWEQLYGNPLGGDDWGLRSVQIILLDLGYPPGPIDGVMGDETRGALKAFQKDNGLPQTGANDKATRAKLFPAYMDKHCRDPKGEPFKLVADDFLARLQDAKGKGDYQGCGEFNPLLVFAKAESDAYAKAKDKTERNADNAPNRRVLVFLFPPGTRVTPAGWPCPRASEGCAGCRQRFWSDGERRRAPAAERREFQRTRDTFACRFYQSMARRSACERILEVYRVRLLDLFARPIPFAPYRVISDGRHTTGMADGTGWALVRTTDVSPSATVDWGFPPTEPDLPPELVYHADVHLLIEGAKEEVGRKKLENLGFRLGNTLEVKVRAFQRAYGLVESGLLDDIEPQLAAYHDQAEPDPLPDAGEGPDSGEGIGD